MNRLAYEERARSLGYRQIAGVDEAGRGPLAGPVVAAACILPETDVVEGIDDSKKLTPQHRYRLFEELLRVPGLSFGIGVVDSLVIDRVNILQATFLAMQVAVDQLPKTTDYLLIDGPLVPKIPIPAEGVVRGDGLSLSIAAASILAKVTRDLLMEAFGQTFPEYGFEGHKGYGTKGHLEALAKQGPTPIHRMSFAPLRTP